LTGTTTTQDLRRWYNASWGFGWPPKAGRETQMIVAPETSGPDWPRFECRDPPAPADTLLHQGAPDEPRASEHQDLTNPLSGVRSLSPPAGLVGGRTQPSFRRPGSGNSSGDPLHDGRSLRSILVGRLKAACAGPVQACIGLATLHLHLIGPCCSGEVQCWCGESAVLVHGADRSLPLDWLRDLRASRSRKRTSRHGCVRGTIAGQPKAAQHWAAPVRPR
jgi:hypothetical protein